MSNNQTEQTKAVPMRCWRCGRIIYENIKTGHTGCRNTKCLGYLPKSKWLSEEELRAVVR